MKNRKGVTLIALVITIIVLLILAGVSISIIVGDNGLLKQAQEAKVKTDRAQREEQEQMDNISWNLKNYVEFYDEEKGCNRPKLTTGMVPVNYNFETQEWEQCEEKDWVWDYIPQTSTTENGGTSKWANAMTEDGSLWVWIPRYAYCIKSGYHSNVTGEIDIVFLKGATNEDGEGNTYSKSYDIDESTTNGAMSDFVVHPTFGSDLEQGGWSSDIPGFWVAKFEAGFAGIPGVPTSAQDSTVKYTANMQADTDDKLDSIYGEIVVNETYMKYPVFQPGKFSYACISVGDSYGLAKYLNAKGNPYGFSADCSNTHLIKNSEWGAIAYLTHSKYGRNGTEISINNWEASGGEYKYVTSNNGIIYSIHTGYSSGSDVNADTNNGDVSTTNYYNTNQGVLASTTGNVFGVYDMSGGLHEWVAAFSDKLDYPGNERFGPTSVFLNKYGSYMIEDNYGKILNNLSIDINKLEASDTNSAAVIAHLNTHRNIFGDSIWEISNRVYGINAWNSDAANYVYASSPFIYRGGLYSDGESAGIFCYKSQRGRLAEDATFRACVVSPD